ncbi:alpha/beta hydrolase [Roseobacter cerasinus]|uniref:Alpha/beta hydrolase n=1 Tax=Roseobacter cerasinus TaxID=2602289 RepID=A0A640VWE9_9RHOB|nr:alpha/beta hydrolase [Roseobacter cerasinus]GFE51235.1 alpha/beta hydrolase [Roseobacter cerasinus]
MRWLGRLILVFLIGLIAVPLGFRGAATLRETQPLAAVLPDSGRLVATTEGQIFVLEYGPKDGTVLLFLHGTAAWSGLWQPTLETMAALGYRAIGFDMPPFGFSERAADGDYSRTRSADRLLALIQTMEIRPVLVAHSFGAGAGVEAAMRDPDAFAGLVVVDGALGLDSHLTDKPLPLPLRSATMREMALSATATNPLLTKRLLKSLIHVKEAASDEVVAVLQRPMVRMGSTAAFAEWLPALLVPPIEARSTHPEAYRALTLPTAFLWGEKDSVTPLNQGEILAALVPGAKLSVLPGLGHIPQVEGPAQFEAALASVLPAP